MLIPSESVCDEIDRILSDLEAGDIDLATAGKSVIRLDPEEGAGYFLLARADEEDAGGASLQPAENLAWEALQRKPMGHILYLSLADLRQAKDPLDPIVKGLSVLGLWKLAMAEEIDQPVADEFRERIDHPDFKAEDPASYAMLAGSMEEEIEEDPEPPEVARRLLPYRLLNRLQMESETMTPQLMDEILDNAAACLPVWRGILWEWGRNDQAVDATTLRLATAFLGEIGGPEVLEDLIVLATHPDLPLMLHAHWAIHRLGQRFPKETLAAFHAAAPGAIVSLRCGLAEQIAMLPDVPGRELALLEVVRDFPAIAAETDAPYLLLATCNALEQIGCPIRAKETLVRFERLLTRQGREWFQDQLDEEGGFLPLLADRGLEGSTLRDVVVDRILLEDELEDAGDLDGGDEPQGEEAEQSPPKPGRNDPCWCGSGKKYKKCHLDEDEAKARGR